MSNTETINMRQFNGSIFDLFGGLTKLPKTEPSGTDLASRKAVLVMKFRPASWWPACRQENFDARLKRVGNALLRVGDLLG